MVGDINKLQGLINQQATEFMGNNQIAMSKLVFVLIIGFGAQRPDYSVDQHCCFTYKN